jgi:UPF0716 protein FxsA
MRAQDFVSRGRPRWQRLEELLGAARAGHRMRPRDAITLAALYRRATSDLARAQRDWPEEPVTRYLNGLVGRGHGTVYRGGGEVRRRLWRFYARTVPVTYRASGPFLLAAAALTFGSASLSFVATLLRPELGQALVPADILQLVQHHRLWTDIPPDQQPVVSGVLFDHNLQVALAAFALGVVFALPTIAILLADSVIGSWLLRHQGRAAWVRFRLAVAEGRPPAREVLDGALVIFGGAFLITPGFITDVVGVLLLLPPTRALFRRWLARRFRSRVVVAVTGPRARRGERHYDVDGSAVEVEQERLGR